LAWLSSLAVRADGFPAVSGHGQTMNEQPGKRA